MGAHPDDYKRSAPPNSYIHVDEFESPKHLAEYLLKLDQDDDLYSSYFRWKGTGDNINTKFWCRLCSMVNIAPQYPMWYDSVNMFWRGPGVCVQPKSDGKWATWQNVTRTDAYANSTNYGYARKGGRTS